MSIRREPTYLSREIWRSLWLIAKARSGDVERITTADEMADDMLRALIKEKYPQLLEHQRQVEKMEKELVKTLQ